MNEHDPVSLQACHVPAYGLHDGGRVLECSPELARIFGYGSPDAMVGREALGFLDPEHVDAAVRTALAEPGQRIRTRALRADGSSFPIEVSSNKVQHRGGVARLFMVRDVSPLAVVVDDDNVVKNLVAALLRMAGYQTCAFHEPERLLKAFAPGLASVLVTDIRMPVRDGIALAGELRQSDPDLPVVFVSGFSDSPVPGGDPQTQFVQKPFGLADLTQALGKLPERARRELG
jgi:PAS domain S-box-containing protein